ncbi:MAG: cupin domain-containing protein [Oscillospiraceae bacterium]
MVKRTVAELEAYAAPGHFNMVAMRIHGKEETGAQKFWMGVSTFLPGGGAEYGYEDNPLEKVYYILEGEMTVTDKAGKKYVIHKDEAITFAPNEGRGLLNESNLPARMLVIINYPAAN